MNTIPVPVPSNRRKRRLMLFVVALISVVGVLIGIRERRIHNQKRADVARLEWKFTRARHPIQPESESPRTHQFEFVISAPQANRLTEYDNPWQDALFFQAQRVAPQERKIGKGPISYAKYLAASAQLFRMPQFSTALNRKLPSRATMAALGQLTLSGSSLVQNTIQPTASAGVLAQWKSLGPNNVGGRTRCLIIDPHDPNIMYAAAASGGVWKSGDGGSTWTPIADFLANIAVNSLAIDPNDPNILFAGTGEGYLNIDATRGQGIFETTDGGAHWHQLASTNTKHFYYVRKIAISPTDSKRIYAATATGLFRSENSGVSWDRLLDQADILGCLDLAIQPGAPNYVFASCGTFYPGAIFRSTDAAGQQQWKEVVRIPNMGRTSLAIAPSDQKTMYALSASVAGGTFDGGLLAVLRSDSNGDPGSWNATVNNASTNVVNRLLLSNPVQAVYADCFGKDKDQYLNQGWYDNALAVDPKDSNIVWIGGTDLFRSNDGGRNWGVASYWWFESGKDPEYAHADHHVIVFHPQYDGTSNQVMFVGNDGGVFVTQNARSSVGTDLSSVCGQAPADDVHWTARNGSYAVTQFYSGAVFPTGASYFGGTQDNGTVRGNNNAGPNNWSTVQGGDGGFVAIEPGNPSVLYTSFTGPTIRKSVDDGQTFSDANVGLTACDQNSQPQGCTVFPFIVPFSLDPSNSQVLWTGGDQLFRSVNGGDSWTQASTRLDSSHYPADNPPAASGVLSAIAIDPTGSNVVIAGFAPSTSLNAGGGWVHRTETASSASDSTVWSRVRPRAGWVSSITFDPSHSGVVYSTYSSFNSDDGLDKGHIFKSTDRGKSWSPIDGMGAQGVPDIPVHSLVIDPSDANRLYVGTDLGVLVTLDGGHSWNVENSAFPNVVVQQLLLLPGNPARLYAFTHGRGLWVVDVKK